MAIIHTVGDKRHKLSNVDKILRKANCSVCGPTRIFLKKNTPRCYTKQFCERYRIGSYIGMNAIEDIIGTRPESCPICNKNKPLSIDHDHETNELRGWLCRSCNLILGLADDKPEVLQKLTKYLIKRKN